jgi:hypothetical protein
MHTVQIDSTSQGSGSSQASALSQSSTRRSKTPAHGFLPFPLSLAPFMPTSRIPRLSHSRIQIYENAQPTASSPSPFPSPLLCPRRAPPLPLSLAPFIPMLRIPRLSHFSHPNLLRTSAIQTVPGPSCRYFPLARSNIASVRSAMPSNGDSGSARLMPPHPRLKVQMDEPWSEVEVTAIFSPV